MQFGLTCRLDGSSLAEQMRGSRFGTRRTPPVFGPLSKFLIRSFPTPVLRLPAPLSMDLSSVFSKAAISVSGHVSTLRNHLFLWAITRKLFVIALLPHPRKVTTLAQATT